MSERSFQPGDYVEILHSFEALRAVILPGRPDDAPHQLHVWIEKDPDTPSHYVPKDLVRFVRHLSLDELLTHQDDEVRNIGLENKQLSEEIRKAKQWRPTS